MNNINKGGTKNANTKQKLSDFELDYQEEQEHQEFRHSLRDNTPSRVHVLVRGVRNRLLRFVLVRCSIQQLDKALKEKTGKAPTRSSNSRYHAKGYNEGVQAERNRIMQAIK